MGFEFPNSKKFVQQRRSFRWEGNEGAEHNLEYGWRLHLYIKKSYEPEISAKRQILKRTASKFDLLVFFNSSLLDAKLLLFELWKMAVEWDRPIKDQYAERWKEIYEDLNAIKEKKLQRFVGNKEAELL